MFYNFIVLREKLKIMTQDPRQELHDGQERRT